MEELKGVSVGLYNLTTTTKTGGVETFVWELGRELQRRGLRVELIGGRSERPDRYPGLTVRRYPFIDRTVFRKLPGLDRAFAITKLLERITFAATTLPLLLRRRYDILHIQKPYDLPVALLVRALVGAKVILGCHGEDFWPGDRLFGQRVDGAVSCSAFNAATVQAHYGILPRVIYNGYDAERFQPQPADPELRRRFAPNGEAILLYAGRLIPWKGAQYAIRALAQVPAAVLVLAGDGHYRPTLEALARELELEQRVRFLGNVPHQELPVLMSSSDLLLATSFASETFGIALVEAQSCKLPVVASRFGGFVEVVQHGETGLLVPPQDPVALAEAVRQLLADPERRRAMGQAGRRWVQSEFHWERVSERVLQAYAAVL
ncbi:MAG: glycosyltransferase family 4 protein [Chloroflexia bacterium]|nr:glycosyltransferase family 4 protein [Chloroflexia bacterium]